MQDHHRASLIVTQTMIDAGLAVLSEVEPGGRDQFLVAGVANIVAALELAGMSRDQFLRAVDTSRVIMALAPDGRT